MKRWTLIVLLIACGFQTWSAPVATNKWDKEIAAFEASDRTNPPPKGAVLFIGSSSIRLWKTLSNDFPHIQVINRGFGGSQVADATHYADRIIWPYEPRKIVFYSGDNDLAASLRPQQVFTNWKQFVSRVRERLPETEIIFIAIKPSPKRWNLASEQKKANELIKNHCDSEQNLRFIDIFTPMLTASGQPRPELFVADQLHLNEEGYRLWRSRIAPAVSRSLAK